MFVDSHCHLDRLKQATNKEEIAQLLNQARQRGVTHFLCVNIDATSYPNMKDLVSGLPDVSLSCGIHPLYLEHQPDFQLVAQYAEDEEVVAIGETGLDYYYSAESKAIQQNYFEQHIELACKVKKPLIVHTRDARADTIALLKANHADRASGVLHCFTENWDMAKAALDLGFYISLSGIVTFKNAVALQDIAKKLPLDRLLIETDSPYLAPVPHRSKENQPSYVVEVANYLATLRQETLAELAQATTDNFFTLFNKAKK